MIPADTLLDPKRRGTRAQTLQHGIERLVVAQEHAIAEIVEACERYDAGFCEPNRPAASFLFLGPTGTGKTRIVEALAQAAHGNPQSVLKVDCGEFQHSHEISKLIGSPPGYLGHRETSPMLTQQRLNGIRSDHCPLAFVLFDEIEKANDALWNILLGVLDKATVTLGDMRTVDFSHTLIFMTGNLGAKEMAAGATGMGFHAADGLRALSADQTTRIATEAARRKFTPEFFNRIDHVLSFRSLTENDLKRILGIELSALQQRIFDRGAAKAFSFRLSDSVFDAVMREGYDPRYGARHLKRAIARMIARPLARLVSSGQIEGGDSIRIDRDGEKTTFRCVAKAVETPRMKAGA